MGQTAVLPKFILFSFSVVFWSLWKFNFNKLSITLLKKTTPFPSLKNILPAKCTAWKVSVFGVNLVRIFPHTNIAANAILCTLGVTVLKPATLSMCCLLIRRVMRRKKDWTLNIVRKSTKLVYTILQKIQLFRKFWRITHAGKLSRGFCFSKVIQWMSVTFQQTYTYSKPTVCSLKNGVKYVQC